MARRAVSWKRILTIFFIALFTIICLFPILYLTVYQWADSVICPRVIGYRLGIEPNYPAIMEYIQTTLTPGIDRFEVRNRLEKIGQVKGYNEFMKNQSDEIFLILCFDPLDSYTILADFSPDGKLINIKFDSGE